MIFLLLEQKKERADEGRMHAKRKGIRNGNRPPQGDDLGRVHCREEWKVNISVNNGTERIWSNTHDTSPEEQAIKLMVATCFGPALEWRAWLIYLKKTGRGVSLIVGPVRPNRKALRRAYRHIDVAAVHPKFQVLLATEGPSGLQWNGKEVVARGN
jgi:hypothetical protein